MKYLLSVIALSLTLSFTPLVHAADTGILDMVRRVGSLIFNGKSPTQQGKEKEIEIRRRGIENIFNTKSADSTDQTPSQTTPTPFTTLFPVSPVPSRTPNGLEVNQGFESLTQFYDYVGKKVGVPPCVLEAVSYMEYQAVWNYTPGQIGQYIQPGQVIPNCPLNLCSAAGHMQMTTGIDDRGSPACGRCGLTSCPNAWASHGRAVNEYESASHLPNVCNMRDSTFGAARKLKKDSGTSDGNMNWTTENYLTAGKRYYGSGTQRFERLGNRTYGEYMAYHCGL